MTSDQIIKDASSETDFKDYTLLDMQLSLLIKQILKMYFNHQISKEEAQRYKLQAVKKYEMDKKSEITNARNDGRKEGLIEGKKEGLIEGKKEGLIEGKKEGLMEGKKEGLIEGQKQIALNMKNLAC